IVITEQIISDAVIERQTIVGPPGILNVERGFARVGLSEWSIRSGAGEPLRKRNRSPRGKVRIAVELIRPGEIAGKEIADPSNIQIESELIRMGTTLVRQTFHKLIGFGIGVTRADTVPPDLHHQYSILANLRFRHAGDVCCTGLVVANPAEPGFE